MTNRSPYPQNYRNFEMAPAPGRTSRARARVAGIPDITLGAYLNGRWFMELDGRIPVREAVEVMKDIGENVAGVLMEGAFYGLCHISMLERIAQPGRFGGSRPLASVLERRELCLTTSHALEESLYLMHAARMNAMPVIDEGGKLHGILSAGDLSRYVGTFGNAPEGPAGHFARTGSCVDRTI